jgi:hypothetical protein
MAYGSPAVRVGGSGRKYPGGASANHWKRWDAKPEATERQQPLYARSAAIRQTVGNGGTQNLRLRGGGIRSTPVRLRSGKPSETVGRKT